MKGCATTFRNCGAYAASGMGLLAQRCDTVRVSGVAPDVFTDFRRGPVLQLP